MKKQNIRSRLILTTSIIMLGFLTLCTGLFYVFLIYFAQIIEHVYGIDDDILQPFFSIIGVVLVLLIIFALVVSILGGLFVSERFLRNVVSFTEQIKRIKQDGLDKRIPITHHDELDALSKEFNALMDDIEGSIQKQNQFVFDASHELKTPLAIMKGNLEMLQRWGKQDPKVLDESLEVVTLEVNRMITLTSELLQLTKKFDDSDIATIYISKIVERVVHEYQKMHPEFKIEIYVSEVAKIKMKQEHFEQILMILLDNAIKYSKEDIKHITITFHENGLYVKDYGIGIEKQEIEKVFDRLYRIDESRENDENSFGLGLSILKRISEWYGFDVKIKSEKNQYTEFILNFKGGNEDEEIFD
ncbi:MAG: sensor histidine kinase [Breznakia sp.]